ncbi:hypothetical protein Scep_030838 [Stephania cephalantha]|uniref:Beta-galactosidase n=1 Tax=Stephania cephalantha TaxID=152367 RepID=A0AAP0E3U1_9MAGN
MSALQCASVVALLVACSIFCSCCASTPLDVSSDARAITINGQRRIILAGSIHYPRSTPQMWPDLIQKSKEGGLNAIETYVFWNAHEAQYRQYDFSGNLDLVRFLRTIQDAGLYAILRIGPYVCAEWNYGGYPIWLHNMQGIQLRTDNSVYKNEMQNFTTMIVNMMKKEELFASQGGPIIIAQIENEYGNVISSYGEAGKQYINWCASMANSLDIGVPWVMCQETDAPAPMLETCNGWYCDQYEPKNSSTPKMWTENWTGWFKGWGGLDPHRTAEDLAYAVARFFQLGGTLQNYYMYHGGTNFGRTAGGPYIATTYDYDAPLDEFGNLNQPKWGHLKELHLQLMSMEKVLTHGDVSSIDYGNDVQVTIYSYNGTASCFFSNANQTTDTTISFQDNQFTVPAWSVSILPDCKTETYNTAKVNSQTTVFVKKANQAEDEPSSLSWSWRPEHVKETVNNGLGSVSANMLIEQKAATNDTSDYLWYMTSLDLAKDDLILGDDLTLRVNTSGHVLHVYLNGKFLGSQWGGDNGKYDFVFEKKVKLNEGKNQLSLLSATVGLKNYGPMFYDVPTGVAGVELIRKLNDELIVKDLSSSKWTYKVGLHGEDHQIQNVESPHSSKWISDSLPTNRMMTWYKTTFKAPLGNDVVVLDLLGMGKGHAWINGRSIGRFWPTYLAVQDGCQETCDYRGPYSDTKCRTNCGGISQRWYHVPRSFIRDDLNTLVLFEEFGGNPSNVKFQTNVVDKVCAAVEEGHTLELSCQGNGRAISSIEFASFGDPKGSCEAFSSGSCDSAAALSVLQEKCVGQESCSIEVSDALLGSANCGFGVQRKLAVQARCHH